MSTDIKKSQLTKNQLKRLKKKNKPSQPQPTQEEVIINQSNHEVKSEELSNVPNVDGDDNELDLKLTAPGMEEYLKIFEKFKPKDEVTENSDNKLEWLYSDEEDEENEDEGNPKPETISKKKARRINRLSVAELKSLVKKPEIVEAVDTTSKDPRLLVHLKSYKNSIPVPGHWAQKRGFLEGKKGIEKATFQLPSYIADTGIGIQQDAVKEREAEMSLKQKTRQRVQPKMGKLDIDYQKLHDAFFKFQTKPPMSEYGETYYEGKEFETYVKEVKPGELSLGLKEALSIPPLAPPPWLIAMQRYGPPPSYPNLKIPGLNFPIPEGAQWGYHPGGWGKPPVDEYNRPLYGDVFGVLPKYNQDPDEEIDKNLWGEINSEEEEEEEESSEESDEESDENEEDEQQDGEQMDTTAPVDGMETPSGFASVSTTVPGGGLQTPAFIDVRKDGRPSGLDSVVDDESGKELYTVVPEKDTSVEGLMGSERGYDIGGLSKHNAPVLGKEDRGTKVCNLLTYKLHYIYKDYCQRKPGDVDLAINPDDVGKLTDEEIRKAYEAQSQGIRSKVYVPGVDRSEDFTDILKEEHGKRQRREERRRVERNEEKKEKFKFQNLYLI